MSLSARSPAARPGRSLPTAAVSPDGVPTAPKIFLDRRGVLMRMPIRTTPTLQIGRLEKLFDAGTLQALGGGNYDVTADGKRFLMVKRAEA